MYRTLLGDVAFSDLASDDPAEFTTDLSTVSLRAGVSKGFLAVDLAPGAVYDIYSSNVAFDFELECPASECGERYTVSPMGADGARGVRGDLSTAAWNVHGNTGLSLLLLHAVGELGTRRPPWWGSASCGMPGSRLAPPRARSSRAVVSSPAWASASAFDTAGHSLLLRPRHSRPFRGAWRDCIAPRNPLSSGSV